MIVAALEGAGVTAEVEAVVSVPPQSRRRAVFKFAPGKGPCERLVFGFHAAKSHTIVNMQECLVVSPGIFGLIEDLSTRLAPVLQKPGEVHICETLNGFDLAFRCPVEISPALSQNMILALSNLAIARVIFNATLVMETATPEVDFDDVRIKVPPHSFLQPTKAGELALQDRVAKILAKAKTIADLFCGCGTFTFALARTQPVYAVDQDRSMLAALATAAKNYGGAAPNQAKPARPGLKPITTESRDLFKLPLQPNELERFDGVVLDPPRLGALAQVGVLAKSQVATIAYVSCNPHSFTRDAAILKRGGYSLGAITPVDQFLWSSHIELVAQFTRSRN